MESLVKSSSNPIPKKEREQHRGGRLRTPKWQQMPPLLCR
jgi:hypothetical protein